MTAKKHKRPLWYNLSPLNLPLPGLVSIFHRVSGLLLFLAIPFLIYALQLSRADQAGFDAPLASEPGGKSQAEKHSQGDQKPIPAECERAQLENQGARGGEHGQGGHRRGTWGGKNQMPSAACTFST